MPAEREPITIKATESPLGSSAPKETKITPSLIEYVQGLPPDNLRKLFLSIFVTMGKDAAKAELQRVIVEQRGVGFKIKQRMDEKDVSIKSMAGTLGMNVTSIRKATTEIEPHYIQNSAIIMMLGDQRLAFSDQEQQKLFDDHIKEKAKRKKKRGTVFQRQPQAPVVFDDFSPEDTAKLFEVTALALSLKKAKDIVMPKEKKQAKYKLGPLLKEKFREKRGRFSAEEIAEHCGCDPGVIYRYFNGQRLASSKTVNRMIHLLEPDEEQYNKFLELSQKDQDTKSTGIKEKIKAQKNVLQ